MSEQPPTMRRAWPAMATRHVTRPRGAALCGRRTDDEEEEFHKKALVTQKAAAELADRFNHEAAELGIQNLPKVAYMTCCFVVTGKMEPTADGKLGDANEPESRLLFAERRIDGEFRCDHSHCQLASLAMLLLMSSACALTWQQVEYEFWRNCGDT